MELSPVKILGVYRLIKIRVYELAKELGMSSKDLIEKMKELDLNVSSHMSSLESEEAKMIKELFEEDKEVSKEKKNIDKDII